jgi:iron-sulfur cluster insertion protein
MKISKLVAVTLLMFTLVTGCTDSAISPDSAQPKVEALSTEAATELPPAQERQVVKLSDSAVTKFKEFLAGDAMKHIRLSVKDEGPTGFKYDLQIVDSIGESDFVDRSHGFTLVVDPKSSIYLEGASIDWLIQPDGQEGFIFDNPNALKN